MTVCWYWILKVQARFMFGDYEVAIAAAEKAKTLLWAGEGFIQTLDYHYFTALTIAAIWEKLTPEQRDALRTQLMGHCEQLQEWAENYPPTFGDKHALVSAEVARLEGRDADAMLLYEQAIVAARENGFAHVRINGARRIYTVNAEPMRDVDLWLDRFRNFWEPKLSALATEVARGKRRRAKR